MRESVPEDQNQAQTARTHVALIFQYFPCSKACRRANPGFHASGDAWTKDFSAAQKMFMPAGTFRGCFKGHARLHKVCSDAEMFLQVSRNFVRTF